MKTVRLKLDGKMYEKQEPTIGDWFNLQAFDDEFGERNIAADTEASFALVALISKYINADVDLIVKEDISLEILLEVFEQIQDNIVGCFETEEGEKVSEPEKKL